MFAIRYRVFFVQVTVAIAACVAVSALAWWAAVARAEDAPAAPEPTVTESPLSGGAVLGSEAEHPPAAVPAAGGQAAGAPFAGETPNDSVLTKDGTPCVPGAGAPLEEGIEACRNVDLRDFQRKDDDGKDHALSWDRTYNVYNCHASYYWGNYNMGGAAVSTMEAWDECGSTAGLRAKPAYVPGWTTGQWGAAEWLMLAPSGGSVVGYNVSFWCRAYYGWGATMMVGNWEWAVAYAPAYPGQLCYSPGGGTMPTGYYWDGYATELNGEYPGVKLSFHCAFAGSCDNGAAGTYGMGSWIRNIVVTMRDTVTPTFDSGLYSTLADGQWHSSGSYQTGFYAHDGGGGIQNMRYEVDGQTIVNQNSACDYVQTAPCYEQQVYYWDTINTAGISDGAHTLTTRVTDLVGNQNSFNTTIYTDNTAPSAPQNLAVTPDNWTATDSFTVSFDNPGQGPASPIDGFRYKIGSAPTSKTDGTAVDLADGSPTGTVSNLQTGAVGDTPVYVWLYDKAGNTTQASAATGHLKFDDTAPKEAKVAKANGWIGKAEANNYPQTWELPAPPLPQSEIGGYATSLDRDPSGDPGVRVTDPAIPREKLIDLDEEGSWYFHERPISGAGVPGPVDTAELKVDLTDPTSSVSNVPSREWVNTDVALGLFGQDAISGIDPSQPGSGTWFKIDDGAWQEGSSIDLGAEGMHAVTYHATDVAGNTEGEKAVEVGIDKTAPTVAFANAEDPDHPSVVTAIATDRPSGVADATIYYRAKGSGDPYIPLPTSLSGSTAQTTFPDGDVPAGTYQLKAAARDNAGNEGSSSNRQNGQAMLLDAPLRDATRIDAGFAAGSAKPKSRCKKARTKESPRAGSRKKKRCARRAPVLSGRASGARVAFGKGATISGVLVDESDRPIRLARVDVYSRQVIPGAEWLRGGSVATDGEGVFEFRVSPGYSRIFRLRYAGTETRRAAQSKDLELKVEAAIAFKVHPKRLKNGQLLRFGGRVKLNEGAHLPPGGKLVSLEYLDRRAKRRAWKVAGRILRTNEKGVVRGRWRFRNITYPQRIVFSLNALKEETFPYVPGRSRPQKITVRP